MEPLHPQWTTLQRDHELLALETLTIRGDTWDDLIYAGPIERNNKEPTELGILQGSWPIPKHHPIFAA